MGMPACDLPKLFGINDKSCHCDVLSLSCVPPTGRRKRTLAAAAAAAAGLELVPPHQRSAVRASSGEQQAPPHIS
jgi:hypothetical protein